MTFSWTGRILAQLRGRWQDDSSRPGAVRIGHQKLNLQDANSLADPIARRPAVGGADLCILTETPIADVVRHLGAVAVEIVDGPVERTGATGSILSVYIRDPDGSLIEIANPMVG